MKHNADAIAMQDIATQAGVSKATVSRVLNNPGRVSLKTRDKVLAVVAEMGYAPNKIASSLRQGRSRNIAVMLPDITNPYFAPVVRSIEQTAMQRGYSVILNDTQDNPALEQSFADLLHSRQVDGIITNSARIPVSVRGDALPPIINASELCDNDHVVKVGVDNFAIGREATEHLIKLGHTHIAALAGPARLNSSERRLQGFYQAMQAHGLPVAEHQIYHGDYSTESGVAGVKVLMQRKQRPTAIFCFGDLAAIGALHALRELGYQVPDDVSVVSVDGIALGAYLAPPLTTVAQPLALIGERCAQLLLDIIEGSPPQARTHLLPHTLIIRQSTAPR